MAFNAFQQLRRTHTNTSLQDEELSVIGRANSLLSESQSSWVLFSPTNTASEAVVASDILSTTGDSLEERSVHLPFNLSNTGSGRNNHLENDYISSVEQPKYTQATTTTTPQLERNGIASNLNHRINQWKTSEDIYIDDNEASWDLDENIINELITANRLDTSILSESHSYYGDTLFEGYSKKEWAKFKKMANHLKSSLNRKEETNATFPLALTQLLMKLFEQNGSTYSSQISKPYHNDLSNNSGTSESSTQFGTNRFKRYSTVLQSSNAYYNKKFLEKVIQNQIRYSKRSHMNEDTISSTTSSSLVLCEQS